MTINNNNIFGVFTLGEVRSGRLTGEWLNKESVANYGWFGGGFPGAVSTVDRIDFSNDSSTASVRGPLSLARTQLAATGNSNYGWFGGGQTPTSLYSTVDRIDFSNDAATASVRGPLSLIRRGLSATGNSNYGWFGGGFNTVVLSTVERIDFSNDSPTASPRGPLSAASGYGLAATGNSNYGWFGGGFPASSSRVDRIDFSNDSSTASPRGPLSLARNGLAATGNSNYGWFGGGTTNNGSPGLVSRVERIDFSNDSSTTSIRGPLSSLRSTFAATGNSNYGWFGGGFVFAGPISTVDRIDFSNDSFTALVRGPITPATGRNGPAATSGVLNIRRQKAGNYGWFGGGIISAVVDRIDFSNDSSTASPRGPLSLARNQLTATGNSNYGWFGGGTTNSSAPGGTATVDRIDFSNDSGTTPVRGLLSSARRTVSATGNSNYGWFGGGLNPASPASVTTVDRIDFSNDSSTASPRGPLTLARTGPAATGNSNYGWFGGGQTPTLTAFSTVDRIDFSNDGVTASPRGPLSSNRTGVVATGNSNYGWFGGGSGSFPSPSVATVDRIDFSNDSSTASPRGPLSLARNSSAATGNSNYGWFGGGAIPTPASFSTVDRIDFSNDSSTASTRGPLSSARDQLAATSNTPI